MKALTTILLALLMSMGAWGEKITIACTFFDEEENVDVLNMYEIENNILSKFNESGILTESFLIIEMTNSEIIAQTYEFGRNGRLTVEKLKMIHVSSDDERYDKFYWKRFTDAKLNEPEHYNLRVKMLKEESDKYFKNCISDLKDTK